MNQPHQTGAAIRNRIGPALAAPIEMVLGCWGDPEDAVPFELYRLRLAQPVANEFRNAGHAHLDTVADSQIVDFAPGYTPDPDGAAEILQLRRADFDYPQFIDALLNTAAMPQFVPGETPRVAFHCFVVHQANVRAGFLHRAANVVVGRRGISGLLVEGRIERLDTNVLTFSPAVDILIEHGGLWISNAATHRVLFRNSQVLLDAIAANAQAIAGVLPIANLEAFVDACARDPRMMVKLAHVSTQPYLQNLTPQIVGNVIAAYGLPADMLNDAGQLVHDNRPDRRWLILKILDDSYLESTMTQARYEVNSKLEL